MSTKKTVIVPEELKEEFVRAQKRVEEYFQKKKENPCKGTIEIDDQRYILIRAASMSVEFFDVVKKLYADRSDAEAVALARDLLFDVAHAIGMADAKNFHAKMNLRTPIEKLSVGPVHFAYSGWGVVDILPESNPVPNENYVLIYDHPHSFESQAWKAIGRKASFPVCVMNAGYSSGWCEESFGLPLVATEIMCQAKGEQSCRFVMGHPDRIGDHVAAYLKKHSRISPGWDHFEDTGFFKKKMYEDEMRQRELQREIQERQQAQAELLTSEERYRILYENNPAIYFTVDAQGDVLSINRSGCEQLGYPADELVGRSVLGVFFVEDRAIVSRQLAFCLDHPTEAAHGDFRKIRKDGSLMWVKALSRAIRLPDGRPVVFFACQDITEWMRSEHMQRAIYRITEAAQSASSLERLCGSIHAIIGELMPARNFYIALYDRGTDFLQFPYWVDEYDDTPPLDHPGKGLTEYVLRTGQPLLAAPEVFEQLAQAGEVESIGAPSLDWLGVPLKTQAGETIGVMTVQTYSESVRYREADKDVLVFVSTQVAMMIERMRADEALRQSEERYRRMVDNAPLGILTANREGRIIDVNPGLLRILGSPSAEATKAINLFSFPSLVEAGIAADVEKCMGDSRLITGEYPYVSKWGKKVHIRAHLVPIMDRAGAVAGLMAMIEDFTEHRQMEEERRNLEERLRRMEKMEAIGTLAGGVAHDLNNILGVLGGYAELLMMETKADSRAHVHADKILKSSERGAAVIQDLLTLARRGVAVSQVTNLNQIVNECLRTPEFTRLSAEHPQIRVKTSLAPDLLNVIGSPVHIGKTVMNLVLNAAEAMSAGGVITITTDNRFLDRPFKEDDEMKAGDYAVLTVSDTGIGIPPQDIGRIFEPFYTKKKMGRSGTGLGLAVVWGTVKDHKGTIDVQSEVEKGSTFTLYFPATRKSLSLEKPKTSLEQFMGRGESILVVDDLPEQREVAAAMLDKAGYCVHTAASGEEAVKHIAQHAVDLVILDMIMEPGMDGLETFRRIRESNPKQKAIIVSGFTETERARKALEWGAGSYVQKPFIMEKICRAVRRELDKDPVNPPDDLR
jgi:PAS domain S-box-containing protein